MDTFVRSPIRACLEVAKRTRQTDSRSASDRLQKHCAADLHGTTAGANSLYAAKVCGRRRSAPRRRFQGARSDESESVYPSSTSLHQEKYDEAQIRLADRHSGADRRSDDRSQGMNHHAGRGESADRRCDSRAPCGPTSRPADSQQRYIPHRYATRVRQPRTHESGAPRSVFRPDRTSHRTSRAAPNRLIDPVLDAGPHARLVQMVEPVGVEVSRSARAARCRDMPGLNAGWVL